MANDARLIAFHRGDGVDHKGRYLSEIWALSPFWLDHTHDYIQWLFPIPEAGRFNAFAPLLTSEVQAAFERDLLLPQHQQRSLDVMLNFFGLAHESKAISAQPTLSIQPHIWLKANSHNHLRIMRIIRSLALCHQLELAQAFQQAVIEMGAKHGIVSETSVQFWQDAI